MGLRAKTLKFGAERRRLHPLNSLWHRMNGRCLNKNSPDFARYGGRGITISKAWLYFDNFAADMMPSYRTGLQLERINNNSGYSKENCRWATPKEQANNRRSNRIIIYDGRKLTLSQWADFLGINYKTLFSRLNLYRWPIKKAFNKI